MHPLFGFDSPLRLGRPEWPAGIAQPLLERLHEAAVAIALQLHTLLPTAETLQSLFFVSFPCALLAVVLYAAYISRGKDKALIGTRAALMSLYAFITPTQSFWPSQYLVLARSAAASSNNAIHIPLGTLYRDLLDDVVELRYPREHLPLLLTNKLSVTSSIRLDVELFWWFRLLWWMFSCYMRRACTPITPITKYEGSHAQHSASPPPPYPKAPQDPTDIVAASAPPSTLFFSMLYENAPSVSLDCVPYHSLESAIRTLQAALAPGAHLTIGLTTRAGPEAARAFADPRTVLTALPFFPRAYRRRPSQGDERTTTPLFATLPRVLALLTSGRTPLSVALVRNVSEEYAVFLRRSAQDLEHDWEIRDAFVREWGAAAWREERVCTMWEAALVDAGLLAGWAIVVQKPE